MNRWSMHIIRGWIIVVVICGGIVPFVPAVRAQAAAKGRKTGPLLQRILDVYEKGNVRNAVRQARMLGYRIRTREGENLLPVILEPYKGMRAGAVRRNRIEALGIEIDAVSRSYMRCFVPFRLVRRIAEHPDIRLARMPAMAKEMGGMGQYGSESVALTGADVLQAGGIDGSGVKVAVVDLGFIGLQKAIDSGDLSAAGTIVIDLPGSQDDDIETGTAHGSGVAEHVMDMAPGAELYCVKVGDELDLENAADTLAARGVQIANHSVGWYGQSYYDDTGPIDAIINSSSDNDGIFWAVAAGNEARRHWRGAWQDTDSDDILDFSQNPRDEAYDFYVGIPPGYDSVLVVVWFVWDEFDNPVNDLDLYIYRDRWPWDELMAVGGAAQPEVPPAEAAGFYAKSSGWYYVSIEDYSGNAPDGLDLTLHSMYQDFSEPVAGYSLTEPACAHGAFTIAAVDQADWTQQEPPPEPYSSHGPANDGRAKPDITAPDKTSSLTYGSEGSAGTSFSSPTTAGAAALVLQQNSGFSVDGVGYWLTRWARDEGAGGPDSVFGAGLLVVDTVPSSLYPPVVDVPDQVIDEGDVFALLALDDYVDDPDHSDTVLVWEICDTVDMAASVSLGRIVAVTTPGEDWFGDDTLRFTAEDPHGLAGHDTVLFRVRAVNDAPDFYMGLDVGCNEDAGPQAVAAWATGMSPGPQNEMNQELSFELFAGNSALFSSGPSIDPSSGDLTFTPADDSSGFAAVTVVLRDNGGTQNNGIDSTLPQTFVISVQAVNDPPVLMPIGNYAVDEGDTLFFSVEAQDID
ncbi:MAG: S8 family serine peptidase, partial [Chitinivibrionales bacterium]|nr:S8 family serine peptidase [Chitinivibrionales bacterium]